jgi:outer membrane protein OmpA-like peptidoglycan-associated protein
LLEQLGANTEEVYNYVPNPGFETTSGDPCRWNQDGISYMEKYFRDWTSPTETTPDLLSLRNETDCWAHPRKHSQGKQSPKSGDNMMGVKVQGTGGTPTFWHEYLLVKLDSVLHKGNRYYAEMWVLRSERSARASNNLGMLFSDTLIQTNNRLPLYFTPQINAEKPVQTRGTRWTKISGVFEADRDMQYMIIGNFYPDEQTEIVKYPDGERGAYYYIDEILVRDARDGEKLTPVPKTCIPPMPKKKIEETASTDEEPVTAFDFEVGDILELRNIFFDFDKAELLPESKDELDMLVNLLYDFPHMEVEISGHTDNVGGESYNQRLSEARAKAVVEYLVENKTSSSRLSYKGYGFSKPIASNETEEGRQKNRRVEFKVLKN